MPTTATVISDDVQTDGRRRVVYEYDTGTGKAWRQDFLIASATNAQADADSRIAAQDAVYKRLEREQAYALAIDGGDPDSMTLHFNTLAEIRKYVFRAIFNLMRDEFDSPDKANVCGKLAEPTSYMNKFNSASISRFIDDPVWSNPTVGGATNKISAVGVNVPQLDHGEAELSLEF